MRQEKRSWRRGPRGRVHVSNCWSPLSVCHALSSVIEMVTYIWKRLSRICFELKLG